MYVAAVTARRLRLLITGVENETGGIKVTRGNCGAGIMVRRMLVLFNLLHRLMNGKPYVGQMWCVRGEVGPSEIYPIERQGRVTSTKYRCNA